MIFKIADFFSLHFIAFDLKSSIWVGIDLQPSKFGKIYGPIYVFIFCEWCIAKYVRKKNKIPNWLKWVLGGFIAIWIPVYWAGYGLAHFLWLSDLLLIMAVLAAIFESRFLASMACCGGLVSTSVWIVDFLVKSGMVVLGHGVSGGTAYMFDASRPLILRLFSLFHFGMPFLLIWLVKRLGYDRRSFWVQVLFSWVAVALSLVFSSPKANINFVYGFDWWHYGTTLYFALGLLLISLVIYFTHLFLRDVFLKGSK